MEWENFAVLEDTDEIKGVGRDVLGFYTFKGSFSSEESTFEATKFYEEIQYQKFHWGHLNNEKTHFRGYWGWEDR